jgi:hypothetical protein
MTKDPIPTKAFSGLSAPVQRSNGKFLIIILVVAVVAVAIGFYLYNNE